VNGEWKIRHRRVKNDYLVSDPAKPVNLADPDVAALVQKLIDSAEDLARRAPDRPDRQVSGFGVVMSAPVMACPGEFCSGWNSRKNVAGYAG
jgi:hypothetical protein